MGLVFIAQLIFESLNIERRGIIRNINVRYIVQVSEVSSLVSVTIRSVANLRQKIFVEIYFANQRKATSSAIRFCRYDTNLQ